MRDRCALANHAPSAGTAPKPLRSETPPSITQDGDKFWRMPECYIRGSTIKYLRIPDEIIDMVKEEVVAKGRGRGGLQQQKQQKGRGMGGTGRGRPFSPFIASGTCSQLGHGVCPGLAAGGWPQHVAAARPSVDILGWCRHGATGLAQSPLRRAGGDDSQGSPGAAAAACCLPWPRERPRSPWAVLTTPNLPRALLPCSGHRFSLNPGSSPAG